MNEITQQFREELQVLLDRYKNKLKVSCIMSVAYDELHSLKEINGLKVPAKLLEKPDLKFKKMLEGEFKCTD